ncbi:C protein [Phyllostomus bat morbillivirus]|uniref:Protein C n=1 Tax=Phyllostomus bat morbillivirus TaxID=2853285 RepID=A0AAE9HX57_9MONO|nr:C protein [Phyllostomus bat morbillivirus]
MSAKAWNVSRPSGLILSVLKRFRKSASSGTLPSKNLSHPSAQSKTKKILMRISMNHKRQQVAQQDRAHYVQILMDLEKRMDKILEEQMLNDMSPSQDLTYSATMFTVTAVKRLRESRMLTVSWYSQITTVIPMTARERIALMRALVDLVRMIPQNLLQMTGDLLPLLFQLDQQTYQK